MRPMTSYVFHLAVFLANDRDRVLEQQWIQTQARPHQRHVPERCDEHAHAVLPLVEVLRTEPLGDLRVGLWRRGGDDGLLVLAPLAHLDRGTARRVTHDKVHQDVFAVLQLGDGAVERLGQQLGVHVAVVPGERETKG